MLICKSIRNSRFLCVFVCSVSNGNSLACNRTIDVSERQTGRVTSPNFPNKYTRSSKCTTQFVAPDSWRILLVFKEFSLERGSAVSRGRYADHYVRETHWISKLRPLQLVRFFSRLKFGQTWKRWHFCVSPLIWGEPSYPLDCGTRIQNKPFSLIGFGCLVDYHWVRGGSLGVSGNPAEWHANPSHYPCPWVPSGSDTLRAT